MEERNKWRRSSAVSPINTLDDGCLMRIFNFLTPMPDRYSAARVCCRWRHLASDPRMWLHVDTSNNTIAEPGVFCTIEDAVDAARPGDTILIRAGTVHITGNVQINKPLCLIGGGSLPDDTVLVCPKGFDRLQTRLLGKEIGPLEFLLPKFNICALLYSSALEFLATGKVANLTIKAELGSCLIHRDGRLTIDSCVLQCEEHPLEHLCCPIVSTANALPSTPGALPSIIKRENSVSVIETRIEGGAKAVITNGNLTLQQVRVIYARTALIFWFNVSQKCLSDIDASTFTCKT